MALISSQASSHPDVIAWRARIERERRARACEGVNFAALMRETPAGRDDDEIIDTPVTTFTPSARPVHGWR